MDRVNMWRISVTIFYYLLHHFSFSVRPSNGFFWRHHYSSSLVSYLLSRNVVGTSIFISKYLLSFKWHSSNHSSFALFICYLQHEGIIHLTALSFPVSQLVAGFVSFTRTLRCANRAAPPPPSADTREWTVFGGTMPFVLLFCLPSQ